MDQIEDVESEDYRIEQESLSIPGYVPSRKSQLRKKEAYEKFMHPEKMKIEGFEENHHRQTILCSATIPQRQYFASLCQESGWTETLPELLLVHEHQMISENIEHEYVLCKRVEERISLIYFLLERELFTREEIFNPAAQYIVFVDKEAFAESYQKFILHHFQENLIELTKEKKKSGRGRNKVRESDSVFEKEKEKEKEEEQQTRRTAEDWRQVNLKDMITILYDSMNIEERRVAMENFRKGKSKILLCSDLAARGIDIPTTNMVLQMSLPKKADDYLHRAGRTGRLGRPGKVMLIAQPSEEFVIKKFMNSLGIVIYKRVLTRKSGRGEEEADDDVRVNPSEDDHDEEADFDDQDASEK
jgi:superfamily II DNA/RNA helicase